MSFHIPSLVLAASYTIPLFTFSITYAISMNTPRLHKPFDGDVMWVYSGDYHLSTSISHGLARRLGSLGLSIGAVLFLFVVLHKGAYMQALLRKNPALKTKSKLWLVNLLLVAGISSSLFMIFVCCFPESEGLVLHLLFALLYFGSNIAYQLIHIAIDEIFSLDLKEPYLHGLRIWCSYSSIFCLVAVVVSLAVFDNMVLSSAFEILMTVFMLGFFSSLHYQYSHIQVHPYLIAIAE